MVVQGGIKPYQTTQMKDKGVDWQNYAGGWYIVCTFCGGNCGQCGLTGYVDQVPASMEQMIDNLRVRQ
jgi:hypothetical protein